MRISEGQKEKIIKKTFASKSDTISIRLKFEDLNGLVLILVLTYLFPDPGDPFMSSCQHSLRTHFRPWPIIMVLLKNLIKVR